MENNQKIYLDKVIEFIVRDTKIDYDKRGTKFPWDPPSSLPFSFQPFYRFPPTHFSFFLFFSEYCKKVYGLTDLEIEYVWKEYKDIILDKITNK